MYADQIYCYDKSYFAYPEEPSRQHDPYITLVFYLRLAPLYSFVLFDNPVLCYNSIMSIEVLSSGFAATQGPRPEMQDVVVPYTPTGNSSVWYTGVLDGHGPQGWEVALSTSFVMNGLRGSNLSVRDTAREAATTIKDVSETLDEVMGGSTCTEVIVGERKLYVLQLGDSEAVFFPERGGYRRLARVHDPTNRSEVKRVKSEGGYLRGLDRVTYFAHSADKTIMVSRSVGDGSYDFVSHEPEVTSYNLRRLGSGLLIAATDGVWGRDGHQEAAHIIHENPSLIDGQNSLSELAKLLVTTRSEITGDNAAASILQLGHRPSNRPVPIAARRSIFGLASR